MPNIIFFTDYSSHSYDALNYLAGLLKDAPDSNIYLVHAFEVTTKSGMLMSIKDRIKEDATAMLHNRKRQLEKMIDSRHLVFAKAINGQQITVAQRLEKQLNPQVIVCSMLDENSDNKSLFGVRASNLVKQTTVPLLLVPSGHAYQPIKNITFALKKPRIQSASTVDVLKSLFNSNDPDLKILLAEGDDSSSFDIAKLNLEQTRHSVKVSKSASLYQSIAEEQQTDKADLLTVVRRQRGFFEKMINKGTFNKEDLDIDVPMLVLQGAVK